MIDGEPAWFLEQVGARCLAFTTDAEAHAAAAATLAELVTAGRVGSLLVEKVNTARPAAAVMSACAKNKRR